jgi:uncharacterized protein YqgV (UPF0045/DUF77 family)
MDRATKEEKMKKRETEAKELLATLEMLRKQVHGELEKEMGSWWNVLWGKASLKRFQDLYEVITAQMSQRIKDEITLNKMQMQLETLNEMVQKVAEKVDVDLTDLKSKVEAFQKTIETPAFAEVAEFVKALKENVKKTERAHEDYVD